MGHDSDCAVHSEPAYPAGACNCGACDELRQLRADLAAAQRECAIRKEYAESLVRIVGGKYLFSKERFGVCNKTTLALSHLIDEMDKAERRVAELLAQEGGK